jgi:glycosyltransferase involved in cell wall biosynthesis
MTDKVVAPRPRVSAIIIVYNGAEFLAEAIDSVRAQSLSDWELLVVDDGSTDSSREIAARYAETDPARVKLMRHPDGGNHGMSATRNLGLTQARGDFIAFLDADDAWAADKLETQVAMLDAYPAAGMAYGRALIWYSWQPGEQPADFCYDLGVAADRIYQPPELFFVQLRLEFQTPTTGGSLIRRSLIDRVGGFEPRFRGMFEDQVFWAKAMLDAPVFVSDRLCLYYRQHATSSSAVSGAAGRDQGAHLRYLLWLASYLLRTGNLRPIPAVLKTIGRLADFKGRLRRLVRRPAPVG